MKIKPLGFYVLLELVEVEQVTAGGILLPEDLISKEQDATSVGYVRAIGPTAFAGYPGCEPVTGGKPADKWGLYVGQRVEYRKYEGKKSAVPGYENYRYIPDSHIIGDAGDE